MKLRYFKAISRIHSKLANLKVKTYQFDRCVTLTPPVFICQNKGTFGYTVLYKHPKLAVLYLNWFPLQMSKILWIILCFHQSYLKEKLPFMLHLVLKKKWVVASIWQALCYTVFIPVYSGQFMVPVACNIITVLIFFISKCLKYKKVIRGKEKKASSKPRWKKPHESQLKNQNDFSTAWSLGRELHILVQGKKKKIEDIWGRKSQWDSDGRI